MSSTQKTILLVDGNEKTRQSLKEFIISLGHKVCEAITGKDAIDQAFKNNHRTKEVATRRQLIGEQVGATRPTNEAI